MHKRRTHKKNWDWEFGIYDQEKQVCGETPRETFLQLSIQRPNSGMNSKSGEKNNLLVEKKKENAICVPLIYYFA